LSKDLLSASLDTFESVLVFGELSICRLAQSQKCNLEFRLFLNTKGFSSRLWAADAALAIAASIR
jgi:hypothetical protein